jgi:tetratricopeptide (TPR) repeat protein
LVLAAGSGIIAIVHRHDRYRMSRFSNLEFGGTQERQVASTEAVSDEVRLLGEADGAFRAGYFEQALRLYGRVLESNPRSVPAWNGQLRMLIEMGDLAEARVWADRALELLPNEPELLAAKGVTLARSGDTEAALAFSDAAVAERGDSPYVWLARGDVLLARAEKRANFCFAKALAAAPGDWLWSWLASRIHLFYRRFALALKLARQALALEVGSAVVWLQLGRCQLALGLAGDAQQALDQARQLDPACPETLAAREEFRSRSFLTWLAGKWRRLWHA